MITWKGQHDYLEITACLLCNYIMITWKDSMITWQGQHVSLAKTDVEVMAWTKLNL